MNISKKILLVLATVSFVAGTKTYAVGSTNLGNGADSGSRYAKVDPMPIIQWCSQRLGLISTIMQNAAMAKLDGASKDEIAGIYEQGLRDLAQGFEGFSSGYSLTYRALVRGITIAQALSDTLGNTEEAYATRIHFLEKYYDFLQYVSSSIDIPYYIPYYNRGNCHENCMPGFSEDDFSAKIIQYAVAQVSLPLSELAIVGNNGQVYPKGVAAGYLTVLEFTTHDAALDLESSLVAASMSCAIGQLNELNQRLARYNAGNRIEFRGRDDWAVQISYNTARSILSSMNVCQQNMGTQQPPYITPRNGEHYSFPTQNNGYITPR